MKYLPVLLTLLLTLSCSTTKITTEMTNSPAQVIIYKTTADYHNLVPVMLNDAKDRIVSYPGKKDLLYNGEPAYPVQLKKGYLLDRRGINSNTAFTKYTYEEYAGLESTPTPDELFESIIDFDPFTAIYECGRMSSYENIPADLNKLIAKRFKNCKKLK